MKANELRIGNYVYDTLGNINQVVVETFVKFNHQIQPIPLTERWLEDFGFEKKVHHESTYEFYDNNYFELSLDGSLYFEGLYTAVDIKYVHQLQNLYFALTGTELVKGGGG